MNRPGQGGPTWEGVEPGVWAETTYGGKRCEILQHLLLFLPFLWLLYVDSLQRNSCHSELYPAVA